MKPFKFEIGDIVYHNLDRDKKENEFKTPLMIIERLYQEGAGGDQISYLCRVGTRPHLASATLESAKLYQFYEIELGKE